MLSIKAVTKHMIPIGKKNVPPAPRKKSGNDNKLQINPAIAIPLTPELSSGMSLGKGVNIFNLKTITYSFIFIIMAFLNILNGIA